MFRLILALAVSSAAPAFAQAPPGLPPELLARLPAGLTGIGAPSADTSYIQADTPSKRFPDATVAGPAFLAGTAVTVLVTEGEWVRVAKGDQFGWVPATALATTPPVPVDPVAPPIPQ
jgi:hypothetical protein